MAQINNINKGEIITAERLNKYGDGVNQLNRNIFLRPNSLEDEIAPEVQAETLEDETAEPVTTDNFIETSRTISQVQIFDQNDTNYALIDRIESITFTNAAGSTITLTFNNPGV
jgi:hypothetical protein